MSEANEQPVPQEAKKESRVVGKVREAVQKGWERIKIDEKIYDELYAGSQPGLEWHGKGIYKLWTENADQVIKRMYDVLPSLKHGRKFFEGAAKINMRVLSGLVVGGSVVADMVYNTVTWPERQVLPIPKDIFKRRISNYTNAGIRAFKEMPDEEFRKTFDVTEMFNKIIKPRQMPAKA